MVIWFLFFPFSSRTARSGPRFARGVSPADGPPCSSSRSLWDASAAPLKASVCWCSLGCGWRWPCSLSFGDLVGGGIWRVMLSPTVREAPRDLLVIFLRAFLCLGWGCFPLVSFAYASVTVFAWTSSKRLCLTREATMGS
jgi:hypothetical protein